MTVTHAPIDAHASARSHYLMPYPDRSGRAHATPIVGTAYDGGAWDGRVDTLPLLRTTDIRSMDRLRTIHAYARRGIAEIDAALDALGQKGAAQ
ncbi:MAG TPA: hypothetical protein VFV66_35885 [Nonomuraea sp.]|nr:hypothetical protein [Nonomuraea sp.]